MGHLKASRSCSQGAKQALVDGWLGRTLPPSASQSNVPTLATPASISATLRIVAKGAYFPCVWLLERCGVSSLFMRYRIMMVSCPLFCIFGWVALALQCSLCIIVGS